MPTIKMSQRRKTKSGAAATLNASFIKSLPAAWRPCLEDKWELMDLVEESFVMMTEEEFSDKYRGKSFVETFMHNANEMERCLSLRGKEKTSVNRFFALVPNTVVEELATYTSEQLVADGKEPTNAIELRRHFLFSWLCGLSNISTHKFWSTDLRRNSVIHNFSLPPHTRYVDLKQSIRGFSLEGRRGDHDDVWNQKNVCSQNYASLKSQCLNRQ